MGSYVDFNSNASFFDAKDVHIERKVWGEEQWIVNKEYCGKKLVLKKNRRCSLHRHATKDEVFYVLSGEVQLELDGETRVLLPGDFAHVRRGTYHRFTGLLDSEIMEFSTHHREEDSDRKEASGHSDPLRFARQSVLLNAFSRVNVLVVGDVILDQYLHGSVDRISPEAPVPVVSVLHRREVLGGAGNSAANIAALGGTVHFISASGKDAAAKSVTALLRKAKIYSKLLAVPDRKTSTKERIIGNNGQQMMRLDSEDKFLINHVTEHTMIAAVKKIIRNIDVVLISDYAKGVVTPTLVSILSRLSKKHGIPLVIDPKPRPQIPLSLLADATLITPNLREATLLTTLSHLETPESIGNNLSRSMKGSCLVTRGSNGMDLWKNGKMIIHFSAHSPEVVDVSGAGDTVAAVAALCLGAGASILDAVDIANRAASVVVRKQGTATLRPDELNAAL